MPRAAALPIPTNEELERMRSTAAYLRKLKSSGEMSDDTEDRVADLEMSLDSYIYKFIESMAGELLQRRKPSNIFTASF